MTNLNEREISDMVAAMAVTGVTSEEDEFGPEVEIEVEDEDFDYDWDEYETDTDAPAEDAIADDFYFEDDGQPTEYDEWQDVNGGDDWDHGQFDY